jgi:hypothetical protein
MATILQEIGFIDAPKLFAQCPKFKCKPNATNCCYCLILYNQPDLVNVSSVLEKTCNHNGYQVLFLPKFHCELNFIEQCWGYSRGMH